MSLPLCVLHLPCSTSDLYSTWEPRLGQRIVGTWESSQQYYHLNMMREYKLLILS